MDAKDFISKINSQVDVVKFMRLKGINLNDKKQREKIAANQKEFIEKFKSKELFKEAAIRNNQATFESVHLSREQIEKQRRIQKMQQRVNDHFKNNPIKLHGIGLPDNFFKLFDQQTEQEHAMEKKQKLAKHQQIEIDVNFSKQTAKRYKDKQENAYYNQLKAHTRNIKNLVKEQMVSNESMQVIEGVEIVSMDEKERIEDEEIGDPSLIPPADRLRRARNNESKQNFNTIDRIKSKQYYQYLKDDQILHAIKSLDLPSENESTITIPSSNATIYKDTNVRLEKIMSPREDLIRNRSNEQLRMIKSKCEVDHIDSVITKYLRLDQSNSTLENEKQKLLNNIYAKSLRGQTKYGSIHHKRR